jgi:hypothetical protein
VTTDLYTRYMHASRAWTDHRSRCTACQLDQRCASGIRLYQQFAELQDAYLNRKP